VPTENTQTSLPASFPRRRLSQFVEASQWHTWPTGVSLRLARKDRVTVAGPPPIYTGFPIKLVRNSESTASDRGKFSSGRQAIQSFSLPLLLLSLALDFGNPCWNDAAGSERLGRPTISSRWSINHATTYKTHPYPISNALPIPTEYSRSSASSLEHLNISLRVVLRTFPACRARLSDRHGDLTLL